MPIRTAKEELERDQMLACKGDRILVVENEVEHRHLLREGGWLFKIYTPSRPNKPPASLNWIEDTPTGMRIPLGE